MTLEPPTRDTTGARPRRDDPLGTRPMPRPLEDALAADGSTVGRRC